MRLVVWQVGPLYAIFGSVIFKPRAPPKAAGEAAYLSHGGIIVL